MKKTLFIHSLFRSGSTYFFNNLRQSDKFTCFYEPLHQDLVQLKKENIDTFWGFTPTSEITAQQNHPKLTDPHFKEYDALYLDTDSTLPFFEKSYAFDEYTEVQSPNFKKYINNLTNLGANRKSISMLQFNRTTLRIDWFKKEYPNALNIVLLRNPKDQFESYLKRSANIFEIMNLLIIKSSPLFSNLVQKYSIPIFDNTDFQKERQYYENINNQLSLETKYEIFFSIWIESLIHAVSHADHIILVDKLSQDPNYVEEIKNIFSENYNYLPNFSDFNIQQYKCYSLDTKTLNHTEEIVLDIYNLPERAKAIYKVLSTKNIKHINIGVTQNIYSKPLVTIITVSYNAVDDLERTIQSILNQTYPNIEYIVIDGNSTDGSIEIIKNYADKISYWISEPDEGIYYAMNKGIDIATGEWINFMNAGDTFVNTNVVERFVNLAKSKSDICYGSRYIYNQTNTLPRLEKAQDVSKLYSTMPFGHQATFTKRFLLKKYKFNLSYMLSADYDFLLKCYRNGYIFQNLDLIVCNFIMGGLSTQHSLKSRIEAIKILSDYVNEDRVKNSLLYQNLEIHNLKIEELKLETEELKSETEELKSELSKKQLETEELKSELSKKQLETEELKSEFSKKQKIINHKNKELSKIYASKKYRFAETISKPYRLLKNIVNGDK